MSTVGRSGPKGMRVLSSADILSVLWTRGVLGLGTHLFISVIESSCHLQSNHSKVDAIPLSVLPKDTTSELASLFPY